MSNTFIEQKKSENQLLENSISSTSNENKKLVKRMRVATVLAPILIGVLMAISFFVLKSFLSKQHDDATVINISGKQRMLSQRIAKHSVYMTITRGEQQVQHINALNTSLKSFKEAHQNLTKKSNTLGFSENYQLSDDIQNLYESLEPYHKGLIEGADDLLVANILPDSAERAEKLRTDFEKIERNESSFLPIMDAIVFAYDKEGQEKIATLRWVQGGVAVLVSLFTVFLAFGFRPTVSKVKQAFIDVEEANNELATQNEELAASEEEIRQNAEELVSINDNLKVSERTLQIYINRVGEAKKMAKLAAYDFDVVTGKITHTEHLNFVLGLDENIKITDKVIAEYIHYEDKTMVFDERQKAITHREDVFYRFRLKTEKFEDWHWFQGATHVVLDENKKLEYVVNVLQDITETVLKEREIQELLEESQSRQEELQSSEEELRQNSEELQTINDNLFVAQRKAEENQKQLQSLSDNLQGIMFRSQINAEWTMEFISSGTEKLTGYKAEEFVASGKRSFADSIYEEDNFVDDEIDFAIKNKTSYQIEYRLVHKNSIVTWVEETGTPVFDAEGKAIYIDGVIMDISSRKQSEEFIQLQKSYLDEAQSLARVVSYDMDIYSKEVIWSESFSTVFDTSKQNIPKTIDEFQTWIPKNNLEKAEEGWAKAVIDKSQFDETYPINTPKENTFYIRERGYPIFDKTGNLISIRGTFQDITQVQLANKEIERKSQVIEKQNTKFVSSVNYAQRIQSAMLGGTQDIKTTFKDGFIFFEPKDVVSGDFYWYAQQGTRKIAIVGDCTGHGVPGAFMSLLGTTILNEVVRQRQITTPSKILDELQKEIHHILKQDTTGNRDGMDISVAVLDESVGMLEFAGAKNPLIYIHKKRKKGGQDSNLTIIKGDNLSIGGRRPKTVDILYTNHVIDVENVEAFYLYSDGYQDQFGGEKGGKFMSTKFRQLLYDTHSTSMRHQRVSLKRTLMNWMGTENDQIDDICVMGITI